MTRRADRQDAEAGAAAVEFALVSALLFTLLFGIIQYSYFFFQSQGASATTREASRLAAVGVNSCTAFEAAVVQRADANGTDIADTSPPSSDIDLEITKGTGNTAANPEPGDRAVVRVTWVPQRFGFPFVPFLTNNQDSEAETRVESTGTLAGLTC